MARDDSRAAHWGAAIISGIFGVIITLLGVKYRDYRNPDCPLEEGLKQQIEERNSQIENLNARLVAQSQAQASLQRDLEACQEEQRPAGDQPCKSTSNPPLPSTETTKVDPPPVEPVIAAQAAGGLKVELEQCLDMGSAIRCEFRVTNLRDDRQVILWGNSASLLVDQDGNEIGARTAKLGGDIRMSMRSLSVLIKDVPVKSALTFEGVPTSAHKASVLQISFADGSGSSGNFSVRFRDVPINR